MMALGSAARDWVGLWQGFDKLAMSIDRVEYDEEERRIIVAATVVNESGQRLRIHVLDTGLRLSGRSITGGSEQFTQLVLEPGEARELQTTQRVPTQDVEVVEDRLAGGEDVWNVSGRIQVSVEGLSEPLWLPFRYELGAER